MKTIALGLLLLALAGCSAFPVVGVAICPEGNRCVFFMEKSPLEVKVLPIETKPEGV